MRTSLAALTVASFALASGLSAQETWPGTPLGERPWENDTVIADGQGLCNTKASENVFVQYDVKAWRNEFRTNCWWPAFEKRSRYFIKTYDWGSAPPLPLIAARGYKPPSIDIWVQGLHEGDRSVPYRRSLTLYRFTCSRGTDRFAAVQFIAYDASDNLVEQWERPSAQMRPAIPDSKEEAFAAAVCN